MLLIVITSTIDAKETYAECRRLGWGTNNIKLMHSEHYEYKVHYEPESEPVLCELCEHKLHCGHVHCGHVHCGHVHCEHVHCEHVHCELVHCEHVHCEHVHCELVHCELVHCEHVHCEHKDDRDTMLKDQKGSYDLILVVKKLSRGLYYPQLSVAGILTKIDSRRRFAQFVSQIQRPFRHSDFEDKITGDIFTATELKQEALFKEYTEKEIVEGMEKLLIS